MTRTLILIVMLAIGCSDDTAPSTDAGASSDTAMDAGLEIDQNQSCDEPRLFGQPNESTGLTDDQCGPSCACSGATAATFTPEQLDRLRTATLLDTNTPFESDPYMDAPPPESAGVCGIVVEAAGYRVQTFDDVEDMRSAGAKLTHWGACGACSSLANFAVYAATTDLTQPVRQCGLDNFDDLDGNIACLEALGFDTPCAQIWAYNTRFTRENCLAECLAGLNDPYNLPDGGLNPCLACDEEVSGPIFKAFAGRTRRNSGLASALCRPCSEALPVEHDYLEDL